MLKVNDIFLSIDGEVNFMGQGKLSMFIRLAGCNLKCSYCDAPDTQNDKNGAPMRTMEIMGKWRMLGEPDKITITGGEPMMQWDGLKSLIDLFIKNQIKVSIETNGTVAIPFKYTHGSLLIGWVVDYKCNMTFVDEYPLTILRENSWIKFVIEDLKGLDRVENTTKRLRSNGSQARFAVSAIHDSIKPKDLINALIERRLWEVSVNVQLHKYLEVQ